MLPADMADGTRAQVHCRQEENVDGGEEGGNPAPDPEVVLPNGVNGDIDPIIPEREEGETREDYSFRVMHAVTQHQIESFSQMIQSMKDISKEVKKKKDEWGDTEEEGEESDNSNYQDAPERPRIRRIRKRIQPPCLKEQLGNAQSPTY